MEEIFDILQQQRETILALDEKISIMANALGQQDKENDDVRKIRLLKPKSSPKEMYKENKDDKAGSSIEFTEASKRPDDSDSKKNGETVDGILEYLGFDSDFCNNGF